VYGFLFDRLNILFHTTAEGEGLGAVVVDVEVVPDSTELAKPEQTDGISSSASSSGSSSASSSASSAVVETLVEQGKGAFEQERANLKHHLSKSGRGQKRNASAGQEAESSKVESASDAQLVSLCTLFHHTESFCFNASNLFAQVTEEELRAALLVVQRFQSGGGDFSDYPLGSPEHDSRKLFRSPSSHHLPHMSGFQ
jgi:hypothetical protein